MDHEPSNQPAATTRAARRKEPTYWDEPDHIAGMGRLEPTFVVVTWLMALAATVVLFALSAGLVALLVERPLTGQANTELGVLMILSAMSTFLGFTIVMSLRLLAVDHDRVINSLAVAALHVVVALLLFLGELTLRSTLGEGVSSVFAGTWSDRLGNAFTVLERSAAAAVIACLLAIGIVPARGPRPQGTQREYAEQDLQL